tara:strand:- start:492 stop:1151 length:660 start_codon:yes stop_codon:yes gene_type:complete
MSLDFADRFKKHDFSLAGSGGEGIAEASGLSTLPGVYKSIEAKGTDWDQFNADFMRIEAAEENALEGIEARTEAEKKLHEAKMYSIRRQERGAETAANKGMWGNFIKAAGLGAGLLIASDERIKNTIEEIDDACKLLKSLRPVTFYYNEEFSSSPERMHYGFIAQEYEHVMPDQTYYDESIDKLCIDTNELIAVLVSAIQQLESRIQLLELSNTVLGAK